MPDPARDPYQTLGVDPEASDEQLRAAYRRMVQLHHPDHNGGSAESERRFEEIQEAYARIRELRASGAGAGTPPPRGRAGTPPGARQTPPAASHPPPSADPRVEARIADLERELREAQLGRERAMKAAREAAAAAGEQRPSDEELGYIRTDDSFSKILADARDELTDRLSDAREHPVGRRVSDLIDELEELASKLTGDSPRRPGR